MPDMPEQSLGWRALIDDRQRQEVALAELYARDFHHGTDGHSRLVLIARLVALLDQAELAHPGICHLLKT